MKAFVSTALIVLSAWSTAQAQTASQLQSDAQAAYAARAYDNAGVQSAAKAAALYGSLVASATEQKAKAKYLVLQSEALYFVGNASTAKDMKVENHQKGMEAADQATKLLGLQAVTGADVEALKTTLSKEDLALLGEALYQRGVNLGQWGAANGVLESLSKWPELRDNMQLIADLGLKQIHEFGAYRTLGRGYFKIPEMLGGSKAKAEKYFSVAVSSTLAQGQVYSTNGYNNLFYAEFLQAQGQTAKAKELLQAFLQADANTLNPASVPENKQAQFEAAELLKSL
jgi:hypothetical protein